MIDFQEFSPFKNFYGFANILFHIKWRISELNFQVVAETLISQNLIFYDLYLKRKNILLVSSFIFQHFVFGHIHNVVSTLANVVKVDVKNDNVDSTLFNFLNFNVGLTFSDVSMPYQPSNIAETTIKHLLGCLFSRSHYQYVSWNRVFHQAKCLAWPTVHIYRI